MAMSPVGSLPWQVGTALTGLSGGIASGAAPVTSGVFQNPVYTGGFTELSFTLDLVLTLGTAETATTAGGWVAVALLKYNALAGPGETPRLNGTQLCPFDGNRYGQIGIVPSAAYTATEWLTVGNLLVPASPYLAVAVFNNSSFTIQTTATWTPNFNFGGAG